MDVEPGTRKITAEIRDEDILIMVNWPITIKKARASQILEPDDLLLYIPLGNIWRVANDIVNTEVQQEEFIWKMEDYIRNHDFLLKYIRVEAQNYPSADQTAFMLRTVPYRPGEEEFLFYFAVDRD